ncbi:hypothetical protein K491DRAFT_685683 [Lophiostoma macrostomum CBS 122681]|uniref:Uncharacterized protein n=1 Tax=Lophiostoma macrostomum CBS 122681 TaxID=1314788 RepID=A0A6A6SHB3_9PLEO|nr:hypothetical protein K491DRAFT_685683 [Lophiostoma macrostomum CBS 122681]
MTLSVVFRHDAFGARSGARNTILTSLSIWTSIPLAMFYVAFSAEWVFLMIAHSHVPSALASPYHAVLSRAFITHTLHPTLLFAGHGFLYASTTPEGPSNLMRRLQLSPNAPLWAGWSSRNGKLRARGSPDPRSTWAPPLGLCATVPARLHPTTIYGPMCARYGCAGYSWPAPNRSKALTLPTSIASHTSRSIAGHDGYIKHHATASRSTALTLRARIVVAHASHGDDCNRNVTTSSTRASTPIPHRRNSFLGTPLLLGAGTVEIDSKDACGWSPLCWAARKGHMAVAKLLVETSKVDVESKDQDGWTLLSWAA